MKRPVSTFSGNGGRVTVTRVTGVAPYTVNGRAQLSNTANTLPPYTSSMWIGARTNVDVVVCDETTTVVVVVPSPTDSAQPSLEVLVPTAL